MIHSWRVAGVSTKDAEAVDALGTYVALVIPSAAPYNFADFSLSV